MKQAIGGVSIFNIMIIFIVAVFALLAAAYSYAKAYKINTRIMNGIEISEGYNDTAVNYINQAMQVLGYLKGKKVDCPPQRNINGVVGNLVTNDKSNYYYCIYEFPATTEANGYYGGCYYSYGVVTYIVIDLPIAPTFELPIVSKTNRIYNFNKSGGSECVG